MFLAALAISQWNYHQKTIFNGKLGLSPIFKHKLGKQDYKNQSKGTFFTKINRIKSRNLYKDYYKKDYIKITKWPQYQKSMKTQTKMMILKLLKLDKPMDETSHNLICQPLCNPDFNAYKINKTIIIVRKKYYSLAYPSYATVLYIYHVTVIKSLKIYLSWRRVNPFSVVKSIEIQWFRLFLFTIKPCKTMLFMDNPVKY